MNRCFFFSLSPPFSTLRGCTILASDLVARGVRTSQGQAGEGNNQGRGMIGGEQLGEDDSEEDGERLSVEAGRRDSSSLSSMEFGVKGVEDHLSFPYDEGGLDQPQRGEKSSPVSPSCPRRSYCRGRSSSVHSLTAKRECRTGLLRSLHRVEVENNEIEGISPVATTPLTFSPSLSASDDGLPQRSHRTFSRTSLSSSLPSSPRHGSRFCPSVHLSCSLLRDQDGTKKKKNEEFSYRKKQGGDDIVSASVGRPPFQHQYHHGSSSVCSLPPPPFAPDPGHRCKKEISTHRPANNPSILISQPSPRRDVKTIDTRVCLSCALSFLTSIAHDDKTTPKGAGAKPPAIPTSAGIGISPTTVPQGKDDGPGSGALRRASLSYEGSPASREKQRPPSSEDEEKPGPLVIIPGSYAHLLLEEEERGVLFPSLGSHTAIPTEPSFNIQGTGMHRRNRNAAEKIDVLSEVLKALSLPREKRSPYERELVRNFIEVYRCARISGFRGEGEEEVPGSGGRKGGEEGGGGEGDGHDKRGRDDVLLNEIEESIRKKKQGGVFPGPLSEASQPERMRFVLGYKKSCCFCFSQVTTSSLSVAGGGYERPHTSMSTLTQTVQKQISTATTPGELPSLPPCRYGKLREKRGDEDSKFRKGGSGSSGLRFLLSRGPLSIFSSYKKRDTSYSDRAVLHDPQLPAGVYAVQRVFQEERGSGYRFPSYRTLMGNSNFSFREKERIHPGGRKQGAGGSEALLSGSVSYRAEGMPKANDRATDKKRDWTDRGRARGGGITTGTTGKFPGQPPPLIGAGHDGGRQGFRGWLTRRGRFRKAVGGTGTSRRRGVSAGISKNKKKRGVSYAQFLYPSRTK